MAQLNSPTALAMDDSGALYILEPSLTRVRIVVATTGVLTTMVVSGTPALAAPVGIALDAVGNVFLADAGGNRVVKAVGTPSPHPPPRVRLSCRILSCLLTFGFPP